MSTSKNGYFYVQYGNDYRKKKPAMALDEFFVMYERFQNNFLKFYNKVPHQPVFLTPLAQNFELSGLWCTTVSICNLKNHLDGWAL